MITKKVTHTDLENLWLQITGFSPDNTRRYPQDGERSYGLLHEQITQGAKTKLKKILKVAQPHLEVWLENKKNISDEEQQDEPFDFTYEPVSIELSKIDAIISKIDYDFTKELVFE